VCDTDCRARDSQCVCLDCGVAELCMCAHVCVYVYRGGRVTRRKEEVRWGRGWEKGGMGIHPCAEHHKVMSFIDLRHTAKHCNTWQDTATHCNALQHTATRCSAQQHNAKHGNTRQHTATHGNTLQHTATHCNTLQHTAAHCNIRQRT